MYTAKSFHDTQAGLHQYYKEAYIGLILHQVMERITIGKILEAAGFELRSIGNRFNPGDIGVSLCSLLINRLAPGTRPRQSPFYIPLMLLTAPISLFMDKILHAPGILEFVAVKKRS